jgi:hypothetical protein
MTAIRHLGKAQPVRANDIGHTKHNNNHTAERKIIIKIKIAHHGAQQCE